MLWLFFALPTKQDFVREYYYSYDLITCVVWVVEVILDVVYFTGLVSLDSTARAVGDEKNWIPSPHPRQRKRIQIESHDDEANNPEANDDVCDNVVVSALFCNDSDEYRPHSLVVELILALYYTLDSFTASIMKLKGIDREDEHLAVDCMINAAGYLYITIRQYREWKERRRKSRSLANPLTKTNSFDTHIMIKSSSSSSGGIAHGYRSED